MSLQELTSSVGNRIDVTDEGEQGNQKPKKHSWLDKFRETAPHFFTPQVVAARESSVAKGQKEPERKPKKFSYIVTRKVQEEFLHVTLRRDSKTPSYRLICNISDQVWTINEGTLIHVPAGPHEWVNIFIGMELLRLNRKELMRGYQYLKELPFA